MAARDSVVIGVFDDRHSAQLAVADLQSAGFPDDHIGFVLRGSDVSFGGMITDTPGAKDARGALAGAATGGIVGGTLAARTSGVFSQP